MAFAVSTSTPFNEQRFNVGFGKALKDRGLDILGQVSIHETPTMLWQEYIFVCTFSTTLDEGKADLPFLTRVLGAYKLLVDGLPEMHPQFMFGVRDADAAKWTHDAWIDLTIDNLRTHAVVSARSDRNGTHDHSTRVLIAARSTPAQMQSAA